MMDPRQLAVHRTVESVVVLGRQAKDGQGAVFKRLGLDGIVQELGQTEFDALDPELGGRADGRKGHHPTVGRAHDHPRVLRTVTGTCARFEFSVKEFVKGTKAFDGFQDIGQVELMEFDKRRNVSLGYRVVKTTALFIRHVGEDAFG